VTVVAAWESALAEALADRPDRLDIEAVRRAFEFSARAHRGQKRLSGEDYISHAVAVARILVELQMDTTTVIAALLHDVVEDADVAIDEIREGFGAEVAGIVDGLTKISTLTFRSSTEEQVENYRKLLLSIARDARVIIVKLADRLHGKGSAGSRSRRARSTPRSRIGSASRAPRPSWRIWRSSSWSRTTIRPWRSRSRPRAPNARR
jgi:(p)ppGpp synthase/HD superfamily hydrolase